MEENKELESLLREKMQGFNDYISRQQTPTETYNTFARFYKWLANKQQSTPYNKWLVYSICTVLSNAVRWALKNKLKFKDFSTDWDWKFVKRVGTFCDNFKHNNGLFDTETKTVWSGIMLHMLETNTDFGTVAYCAQMLEENKVTNFKKLANYYINDDLDNSIKAHTVRKSEDETLFEHAVTGEIMTLHQCLEKGLDPFFLLYINGDLRGCYIRQKLIEETTGLTIEELVKRYPAKDDGEASEAIQLECINVDAQ